MMADKICPVCGASKSTSCSVCQICWNKRCDYYGKNEVPFKDDYGTWDHTNWEKHPNVIARRSEPEVRTRLEWTDGFSPRSVPDWGSEFGFPDLEAKKRELFGEVVIPFDYSYLDKLIDAYPKAEAIEMFGHVFKDLADMLGIKDRREPPVINGVKIYWHAGGGGDCYIRFFSEGMTK